MAGFADLHIHSTASDGKLTPGEVVVLAKKMGFRCIAIADHDSVGGIEEALAAGSEQGVEVLPCVELSTLYKGGEVHILGYFIDWRSTVFLDMLKHIMACRIERARQMVDKLGRLGLDVTWQEVVSRAGSGFVGRPHIAQALMDKKYVSEIKEAFTENFIGKNGRAYVERYEINPGEAVEAIRNAGGVAVLAHPGFFKKQVKLDRADIEYLVSRGLQGVEVYHTKHSEEDVQKYKGIAESLGLAVTGGSDCHGGNTGEILMGRIRVPYIYVEKLKALNYM
ncbi:metal-dependent phosphoesterases [Desulfocucumis palustris]|uniref:Metal-dependent phosphoesterases n=1 Tax=Desulfocucumis palustris TaxID=1898651 RepID=A0A2L2XD31_9FIRM|nr:PHP domain-containing protein [Desulfocucumis palustris]GBF33914.1 metal-dependent phosphoesterases [Desulfocucumis palustris]